MRVWRKYKKNLDIRKENWIFRSISKFSLLKPLKRTRGVPEIYRWCISCRSCQALQNGFQYSNWKNWRRSRQERTLWKKCYTCSVMPKFISLTMTEYCILMIWPWAEPNSKQDVWIESVYSGRWPAPVQGRDLFPRAAPLPPQPASLPNEVCSDLLAIVCVCVLKIERICGTSMRGCSDKFRTSYRPDSTCTFCMLALKSWITC